MGTATEISRGLHRYETYKKDGGGCQACQQMWDEMKRADEQQLQKVTAHLTQHVDKEAQSKAA